MKYVRRELEAPLRKVVKTFPATVLTGPRRAGKTSLLRHLFPKAAYFLLEDPDIVARLRADPQGFLDALLATRHGQILNKTELATPLGVSVPTISQWLGVLEATAQILIVAPFYENLGKRLIKSPKVYLADSGLACHLLRIDSASELAKSPFAGVLFEGFIAAEIVKAQVNAGRRRELYHFRDGQGLEVDFVVPGRGGSLSLVECKAGKTVMPAMAAPMQRLADALRTKRGAGTGVDMCLVHQGPTDRVHSVAPGVRALSWREFVEHL